MKGVSNPISLIAGGNKPVSPSRDDERVASEIIVGWDEMLRRLDDGWEVDQELDKYRFLMKRSTQSG